MTKWSRVLLIIFLGSTGCGRFNSDLAEPGWGSIEKSPSSVVDFTASRVYRSGNELVVYSQIWRQKNVTGTLRGRVEVVLSAPDGRIFERATFKTFPDRIPSRRSRKSNFHGHFPLPPKGSTVTMTFHSESEADEDGEASPQES